MSRPGVVRLRPGKPVPPPPTPQVCGRFFASNTSLGCMGAVSLMQLSLGVLIPSIMCHLLDMRSTGAAQSGVGGAW